MAARSLRAQAPVAAFERVFAQAQPDLPGQRAPEVTRLREEGFARFRDLGIPTSRSEAWRYTNVAKVANRELALASGGGSGPERLMRHTLGGVHARRLIFLNGRLWPQISHAGGLPQGVRIESLARALERRPEEVAAVVALHGDDQGRAFTALNTAFLQDGAWIELDDGVVLDDPVQLLFLTECGETALMCHPRVIVRLGKGASLRLIESHVSLGGSGVLTNLVEQVELGRDARLVHDRLQQATPGGTLIGKASLTLMAGARIDQTQVALGGTLLRNEVEARLTGKGSEAIFSGLAMPRGEEHVDAQLRIHHAAPSCHSDQFYKAVIDERGHSVFAGKIIVHKDAQKTNAYQKNDNLLLSDAAEVDTKPELEIYADDVKCSHGATCGELDEGELFYLRSRGIGAEEARALVTYAFAGEIIERLGDPTVRDAARAAVCARLPGGLDAKELA